MKLIAITLLAFVCVVIADPINVSENNLGDIVSVKIDASVDFSNKVDQTIVNVLVAALNREKGNVSVDDRGRPQAPNLP
jgi:citrate lyase gamma subunit